MVSDGHGQLFLQLATLMSFHIFVPRFYACPVASCCATNRLRCFPDPDGRASSTRNYTFLLLLLTFFALVRLQDATVTSTDKTTLVPGSLLHMTHRQDPLTRARTQAPAFPSTYSPKDQPKNHSSAAPPRIVPSASSFARSLTPAACRCVPP